MTASAMECRLFKRNVYIIKRHFPWRPSWKSARETGGTLIFPQIPILKRLSSSLSWSMFNNKLTIDHFVMYYRFFGICPVKFFPDTFFYTTESNDFQNGGVGS